MSVEEIFKALIKDEKFLERIDETIKTIMKDGKVDEYDVPEIIFLITDTLNVLNTFELTYEELINVIELVYQYIVDKYNFIPEDKKEVFEKLFKCSLKLVMLQPRIKKLTASCFSCCLSKKEENKKEKIQLYKKEEELLKKGKLFSLLPFLKIFSREPQQEVVNKVEEVVAKVEVKTEPVVVEPIVVVEEIKAEPVVVEPIVVVEEVKALEEPVVVVEEVKVEEPVVVVEEAKVELAPATEEPLVGKVELV